jgi:hypothetical protein
MTSTDTTHPLVAAVLDKLPHKANGTAVTHWRQLFLPSVGWSVPEPVLGPAEPIAAKIAAAVLRWAATCDYDYEAWSLEGWLEQVADDIDPPEPTP